MKQLVAYKACGIIATHDLVLGTLEEELPGTNKELPLRSGYKRRGAILLLSTKRRNSPEYECLFLNEQDGNLV